MNATIKTFLSERVTQENIITDVEVTGTTIRVSLTPKIEKKYERPDCQEAVVAYYNDSETVTVQGLGIQGKALRYQVTNIRLGYLNDAGEFKTFNAPVTGVRSDLLVTDEVVDKFLYFDVDRNQSLAESVQLLQDVYGVQSSVSAVERWKKGEAEALPPVGQLIIMLNEKKKITALHLDEYKATGTKSWELAIGDEHGRLLFSIRLKRRDAWHIKAILRWFRMLGLDIKLFYVDFWLAYPPAIKAIYPGADIQYDFFHVIQNIHRHLYKALTAYRKAFKNAKTDKQQAKLRQQLHKKLWQHRYLLFTNEENLSDDQHQILDELLQEHANTVVEQIVLFRQQIRVIFNECDTFAEAVEHLAVLILDGWADLSSHFGKIMKFLQGHIENMLTYLRKPDVQRNSLSECTVRSLRRIEKIRQGFKTHKGRVNHLKLLQWRRYLCS
jgi:Transposase